jgi:asparagine synthase (glutamine-hydrolysing)
LYYASELRRQLAIPDEAQLAPLFAAQHGTSELGRLLYIGTKTELPADMLRKVDRMSMAHSLEVRSPFLDHSLFEYAAGLPDVAKLNRRTTKYMLRQVAKDLLPEQTLKRPKRGFSIPLDRWLREDLRQFTEEVLFDSKTEERGLFDNIAVRQLAEQHLGGKTSRGRELWTLLTIELWQRTYIDEFAYLIESPEPLELRDASTATKGS